MALNSLLPWNDQSIRESLLREMQGYAVFAILSGKGKQKPTTFTMFTVEPENQATTENTTPASSASVVHVTRIWSVASSPLKKSLISSNKLTNNL